MDVARRRTVRNTTGTLVAVVGLAITAAILLRYWSGDKPDFRKNGWIAGLLAAWAVLPSFWFLIDWMLFAPVRDGDNLEQYKQDIEDFKYTQSLSRSIWIAVLALLVTLYGVELKIS